MHPAPLPRSQFDGAKGHLRRILRGVVEVYKGETREVLRRFMLRELSFPECICALDAALAGLVPRMKPDQLDEVRSVMLANNATVMDEMAHRIRIGDC